MPHDFVILTVIYNNYTVLGDFLKSFALQKAENYHIYIADLSSNRKPIPENKKITVILSQNFGYSHGINLCLKKALHDGYNRFCVINSDTYVDKYFGQSVINSFNQNPNSIIGGKIYYAPGFEYHHGRYQKSDLGNIIWYAGGSVDQNHALTPHRGVDEVDKGQYDKFEKTGFVNGCLMCFDKSVFEKVGAWDESYFLYYEDADFCERAKQKGIVLYYDPSIVIWHKNAQSTGGSGSKTHVKHQEMSRLRYGLKFAPFRTKFHLVKNFLFNRLK